MSDEKKLCSKDSRCQDCQNWLQEKLTSCEDWEIKRKESYQKFELRFCPNMGVDKKDDGIIEPPKQDWYVETGGYSFLPCPHGCKKMGIKKNDFGDQVELEHECKIKTDSQVKSSQVKSSQVKSSQVKSSQQSISSLENQNKTNYLPWILGGGILLVGVGIAYFLTKKNNKEIE